MRMLLLVQCHSDKGARVPDPIVYSWADMDDPIGTSKIRRRANQLVSTGDNLMRRGAVQMIAIDINAIGVEPVDRQSQPIDTPSQHRVRLCEPLLPGKYELRAVYSPTGLSDHAEENRLGIGKRPEWKNKRLTTPALVIEVIEKQSRD